MARLHSSVLKGRLNLRLGAGAVACRALDAGHPCRIQPPSNHGPPSQAPNERERQVIVEGPSACEAREFLA
jgi:hypothetical protein